jgi:hypothetical protein
MAGFEVITEGGMSFSAAEPGIAQKEDSSDNERHRRASVQQTRSLVLGGRRSFSKAARPT